MDARIQNWHEDRTAVKLAGDSSAIQASQAHQLKIDNEMLKRENHRLKSALISLAAQSPAKGTAGDLCSPLQTEAAGCNLAAEFNWPLSGSVHQRDDSFVNVEELLAPVAKEYSFAAMDGVQTLHTEKIGGITVENELDRLWKDKILSNLHDNASVDEPVSKSVLCHRNGSGAHPAFIQASEVKKYENGMTLVAMAITGEQWGRLLLREMYDNNSQILFLLVQQQILEKALVLEYQTGARDASSKPPAKAKATFHILQDRLKKNQSGFMNQGMSKEDVDAKFAREITGTTSGMQQKTLTQMFARPLSKKN